MILLSPRRVAASRSTSPRRYTLIAFGGIPRSMNTSAASSLIFSLPESKSYPRLLPGEASDREEQPEHTPQRDHGERVEVGAEVRATDDCAREPLDQGLQRQRVGDRAQEPRRALGVEDVEGDEDDREEDGVHVGRRRLEVRDHVREGDAERRE